MVYEGGAQDNGERKVALILGWSMMIPVALFVPSSSNNVLELIPSKESSKIGTIHKRRRRVCDRG